MIRNPWMNCWTNFRIITDTLQILEGINKEITGGKTSMILGKSLEKFLKKSLEEFMEKALARNFGGTPEDFFWKNLN